MRLLLSVLLGVVCGVLGGYAGLKIAGASTQRTDAGVARISIEPAQTAELRVDVRNPTAELRFTPWTTPVAVRVGLRRTDDALLARAALQDHAARDKLVSAGRTALTNALIHAAIAALLGALVAGLAGGVLLALLTRRVGMAFAVAPWALLACAVLLAVIGVQTRRTINVHALSDPSCPVEPRVSVQSVVSEALAGRQLSHRTTRAIAIRAICTPGFAAQLARLRGHGLALP